MSAPQDLLLFSPSGVVAHAAALGRALPRLRALGFEPRLDPSARARAQRFAGSDETRLAAVHRVADEAPAVAMAVRGGYGLTRLLDGIAWKRLATAAEQGTRWVGHSDFTALNLALFAHTGAASWQGPMATDDFGRSDEAGGVDDVTAPCFAEAMSGELEAVGFRTPAALAGRGSLDGFSARGPLWGGNLAMLCSLLGTRHFPQPAQVKGGLLFLEDVGEHPYRVERMLLQLAQAGVLGAQKAVLLGEFSGWKPSPLDRGYGLKAAFARVQQGLKTPLVPGLPFGHVPTKLTLPVGRRVRMAVEGRDVLLGWG